MKSNRCGGVAAYLSLVALGAAGIGVSPSARAERPLIDIEGATFRPFPIAIPELRAKGPVAAELPRLTSEVLRNDLALSGLFQVLDPRSFIVAPEREGMSVGTINFPAWLNVGADGLVKATVETAGAGLRVELHAFDVVRGRESYKRTFALASVDARAAAHQMADALIELYTGEKGLFRSRIAFARRNGTGKDICVMDVDGHNARCVVSNGHINLLPSWDGTDAILFTSYMNGNTDLYRVQIEGGAIFSVSRRQGLNSGAEVSPDGQRIALTLSKDGNSEVYLLDRKGGVLQRLTQEPWAIDSSPSWSPDGNRIAFVSDRAGTPQIYVMQADGSGVTRLTYQGNYNQTPAWSPRGDRIAFTARDERNVFDIFTIEVDNGRVHRITQDQGNNEEPTWAPNGRMMTFVSDRSGTKAIYLSDADGHVQRRVSTGKAACFTPAWSALLAAP